MSIYCTRAGSCVDKSGYLQNAEGGRDLLIIQVEHQCILACIVILEASCVCVRTMHYKPGSVSRVSGRTDLIPASYRHAWSVCCNVVCTCEAYSLYPKMLLSVA